MSAARGSWLCLTLCFVPSPDERVPPHPSRGWLSFCGKIMTFHSLLRLMHSPSPRDDPPTKCPGRIISLHEMRMFLKNAKEKVCETQHHLTFAKLSAGRDGGDLEGPEAGEDHHGDHHHRRQQQRQEPHTAPPPPAHRRARQIIIFQLSFVPSGTTILCPM